MGSIQTTCHFVCLNPRLGCCFITSWKHRSESQEAMTRDVVFTVIVSSWCGVHAGARPLYSDTCLLDTHYSHRPQSTLLSHGESTRHLCWVLLPWGLSLILYLTTSVAKERSVSQIWLLEVHCAPDRSAGFPRLFNFFYNNEKLKFRL